jgi:hypothetical protein
MTAVDLQGAANIRDRGGLRTRDRRRTRYGLIYRGDSLDSITPADAKILFDKLGIGTIVDLRTAAETELAELSFPVPRYRFSVRPRAGSGASHSLRRPGRRLARCTSATSRAAERRSKDVRGHRGQPARWRADVVSLRQAATRPYGRSPARPGRRDLCEIARDYVKQPERAPRHPACREPLYANRGARASDPAASRPLSASCGCAEHGGPQILPGRRGSAETIAASETFVGAADDIAGTCCEQRRWRGAPGAGGVEAAPPGRRSAADLELRVELRRARGSRSHRRPDGG